MTNARTCQRWLNHIGIAFLLCAAFLVAFPDFDLRASQLLGNPEQGFAAASLPGLSFLRMLLVVLPAASGGLALVALALTPIAPGLRLVETRVLAFVVAAYAIGPGLIVNGLLKSNSGRARPRDIIEFGGHAPYSPPFDFTGPCGGNCSFVSAETSAIATFAVVLMLVFVPCLPAAWRTGARNALVAVVACSALLRVAFGAHFPSDVAFAVLGMAGLVILLFLVFGLHRLCSPFVHGRGSLDRRITRARVARS